MVPDISKDADDLIIASEVGSRQLYEKKYQRPEWPQGLSGVTVGIGYDLGYATPLKIKTDWSPLLASSMVEAMIGCAGITGSEASSKTAEVRSSILVPWDAATAVYEHTDIPQWTEKVCISIPGADRLPPNCLGALVSVAYNRGCSFQMAGDRYREMRAIRSHVMAGELDQVPAEFRSMKRLWGANESGLLVRREKEAKIWEKGLVALPPAPVNTPPLPKPKTSENPPPLAPKTGPGTPEIGTGAGGAIVIGKTAQQAVMAGWEPLLITGLVVSGVIATVGAVAYVRYQRSQPVLARTKG